MSFITGTTLLVLFVTLLLHTVDLTLWHHLSWFVKIVGVGHGIVHYADVDRHVRQSVGDGLELADGLAELPASDTASCSTRST